MSAQKLRVLVPLDGSRRAEAALDAIAPWVRRGKAELRLLRVQRGAAAPVEARAYLEALYRRLREDGIEAAFDLQAGDPARVIARYATEARADLVAMATHGREGWNRLVRGSVAEQILRRADLPVLVCREGRIPSAGGTLVVALDGSALAEEILAPAVRLARPLGMEMDVVRVAVPVIVAPGGVGEIPFTFEPEDPKPYLEQICASLAARGVPVRAVPLSGRAATEILNYAERARASFICMTTHGRTGLSRLIMGSIAEEVVRHAPCPVLVQRAARVPVPR